MKTLQLLVFGALTLGATEPALAQRTYSTEEERNKQIVLDFYKKALNQKNFASASNISAPIRNITPMFSMDLQVGSNILISEENLSAVTRRSYAGLLLMAISSSCVFMSYTSRESRGFATVDIFRLKNSLIKEHWDAVQPVPETSKNDVGMF